MQVVCTCSLHAAIGGLMRGTVTSFLGVSAKLRKETNNFVMSVYVPVRPYAWNKSALIQRIFMKI